MPTTNLYNVAPISIVDKTGISFNAVKVSPGTAGGNINVLEDFAWRSQAGKIDEVPGIILTEFELDQGLWAQRISNILQGVGQVLKNGGADPYLSLYTGTKTGFKYILPYLIKPGDSIRGSIKNDWKPIDAYKYVSKTGISELSRALKGVSDIAELFGTTFTPGYGGEDVLNYSGTAAKSIKITFPLYNTINDKFAIMNFNFVNLFAIQNLKIRTSFLTFIPPKIYTVDGVKGEQGNIYMPAAYVSNYDFISIGTTRTISDYDTGYPIIIPEAYKVMITLTELLPESANIMYGALGGPKTVVVNTK